MLRVFRNRNFAIYFAGRTVSALGDSFYSVALIVAVLQATGSIVSGSMVLIAGTLPVVLFALAGGTLGDRLPRNRIMRSSDLVRSATQFVMAALLLRGHPPLWALLVTQFCYGAGDAFFDPASTGLLPEIVASENLPAANSLLQLSANGAVVAGPALAGLIMAVAGAPLALAFDALSFLLSAVSLSFLALPKRTPALHRESMVRELQAGFAALRERRWVLITACYLTFLAFAFNGPIFVLGPAAALSRLGGPTAWSFMLSAFGVGLIVGSVVALRVLRSRRALGWSFLGNLGIVPLPALLGTSHSEWLVVGSTALAGVAAAVFGVTYPTLLQQTVPTAIVSRVGSYFWLARVAATPLAFAATGPLSARFGMTAIFLAAALSIVLATLVCASFPEVWSVRTDRAQTAR